MCDLICEVIIAVFEAATSTINVFDKIVIEYQKMKKRKIWKSKKI